MSDRRTGIVKLASEKGFGRFILCLDIHHGHVCDIKHAINVSGKSVNAADPE